jgi:Domain of unknown function (DUF4168)
LPCLFVKVIEQAYLYRIEASVALDRLPLGEASRRAALSRSVSGDKLRDFCQSMFEIETLRTVQAERLKHHLSIDELPADVSLGDPTLLPFLRPDVRAVVEAFPVAAEVIVKKHGLAAEDFNRMLEQTKANPIFRWKVHRQMMRTEKEARG